MQNAIKQIVINCKIMKLIVTIEKYGDEETEIRILDDSCGDSEIEEFLYKEYGALGWLAYDIEPE